jgi:hypothetical protein
VRVEKRRIKVALLIARQYKLSKPMRIGKSLDRFLYTNLDVAHYN